ncbi:hypothetical protein D9O50_05095 [Oxalobacteraceae bacterium CAVE-383]|nr:hypothetical protein D9O50_05095 [Oxalobacteraceae bacterium CAVE-383]
MPALFSVLMLAAACLAAPIATAAAGQPIPPPKAGASLAPLFARPVVLRGALNGVQIQMELHLKPGETEALEGRYFAIGQNSGEVLLAGEFEEDALSMEESVNGKDVSGLWDGAYDGVTLSGNWSSVDGSVSRNFSLKIVPAQQ